MMPFAALSRLLAAKPQLTDRECFISRIRWAVASLAPNNLSNLAGRGLRHEIPTSTSPMSIPSRRGRKRLTRHRPGDPSDLVFGSLGALVMKAYRVLF